MKVSGFTFIRNASLLGYPIRESIRSILPICDEFIVNVGDSEDDTFELVKSINDPKIRIIRSQWNEKMVTKGFVYGQQKNIAHYNCNGDWAFYLEGDEIIHEDDLPKIRSLMEKYLDDKKVEALVFDYIHFYCNQNTVLEGPGWMRRAPRVIRNTIRVYSPDGLFFLVLKKNKIGRYPYGVLTHVPIYHYGWMRQESKFKTKVEKVSKYWSHEAKGFKYGQIDPIVVKEYKGKHPAVMKTWLPENPPLLTLDNNYKLTTKDIRQRIKSVIEKIFGVDLSRKHYKLVHK
ncbi:MAG: glycosyltransferase family 2 protein [Thermodesulfovibrionales bacterium]|nr:glycosyltransferase family 2 protein [Thermodesulfovibrionales bacterium]